MITCPNPECRLPNIPERQTCKKCGTQLHTQQPEFEESQEIVDISPEEAQQVYDDLLKLAQGIGGPGAGMACGVLIGGLSLTFLLVICSFMSVQGAADSVGLGVFLALLGLGIPFFFLFRSAQEAQAKVTEIDKVKPGFSKFYTAWRANKDREELLGVAALTLKGAVVAAAVHEAHKEDQFRRDVHDIADVARDVKKKL